MILISLYESCWVMSDSLQAHGLYSPWTSPSQNTGVCSYSLLQEISPTQGSNPDLPHCRQILYQLSHRGSWRKPEYIACLFSSESSWPRNWTGDSCIAGGFLYQLSYQGSPIVSLAYHSLKKNNTLGRKKRQWISPFRWVPRMSRLQALAFSSLCC